jgi:hypothetical protein
MYCDGSMKGVQYPKRTIVNTICCYIILYATMRHRICKKCKQDDYLVYKSKQSNRVSEALNSWYCIAYNFIICTQTKTCILGSLFILVCGWNS